MWCKCVNIQNKDGNTVLHRLLYDARKKSGIDLFCDVLEKLLARKDFNCNITNNRIRTGLDVAREYDLKHSKIYEILRLHTFSSLCFSNKVLETNIRLFLEWFQTIVNFMSLSVAQLMYTVVLQLCHFVFPFVYINKVFKKSAAIRWLLI